MHRLQAFASPVVVILLAGCLSDGAPGTEFGLGLNLDSWPQPGPYLEGNDEVERLERRLNETLGQLLDECRARPEGKRQVESEIDSGNLLFAIWRTIGVCQGDWSSEAQRLADTATTTEQRLVVYQSQLGQALDALAAEKDAIDRLQPGSVIDAEVQASLMQRHDWHLQALKTASTYYASFNDTGNLLDWVTVFTNILAPIRGPPTAIAFIATFPWDSGQCETANPALLSGLRESLQRILNETSMGMGSPLHEDLHNFARQTLVEFELYADNNWWQGMLRLSTGIALDEAVLNISASEGLPSRDEARFLLAQHLVQNRTLVREAWVQRFQETLADTLDWEEFHELDARTAMALREVGPSELAQLRCGLVDVHGTS